MRFVVFLISPISTPAPLYLGDSLENQQPYNHGSCKNQQSNSHWRKNGFGASKTRSWENCYFLTCLAPFIGGSSLHEVSQSLLTRKIPSLGHLSNFTGNYILFQLPEVLISFGVNKSLAKKLNKKTWRQYVH